MVQELVIWPKIVSLYNDESTQSLGKLCLWQCLVFKEKKKNFLQIVCASGGRRGRRQRKSQGGGSSRKLFLWYLSKKFQWYDFFKAPLNSYIVISLKSKKAGIVDDFAASSGRWRQNWPEWRLRVERRSRFLLFFNLSKPLEGGGILLLCFELF